MPNLLLEVSENRRSFFEVSIAEKRMKIKWICVWVGHLNWAKNKAITNLKYSRTQNVLPNPWTMTGFWAFARIKAKILRIPIGYAYQSDCMSDSSNALNSLVNLSPISHTKKIAIIDQNIMTTMVVISNGFSTCSDFEKRRKNNHKIH